MVESYLDLKRSVIFLNMRTRMLSISSTIRTTFKISPIPFESISLQPFLGQDAVGEFISRDNVFEERQGSDGIGRQTGGWKPDHSFERDLLSKGQSGRVFSRKDNLETVFSDRL